MSLFEETPFILNLSMVLGIWAKTDFDNRYISGNDSVVYQ